MRVEYMCRYCKHLVGEINRPEWDYSDATRFCGLNRLDEVERAESVAYNVHEHVIYVQTVCDYCQSAVEQHPELLVDGNPLQ